MVLQKEATSTLDSRVFWLLKSFSISGVSFLQLYPSRPQSLLKVCLASSQLNRLAQSIIYRKLIPPFVRVIRPQNKVLIQKLLENPCITKHVHEIHILWAPSPGIHSKEDGLLKIRALMNLLPSLANPKKLVRMRLTPRLSIHASM